MDLDNMDLLIKFLSGTGWVLALGSLMFAGILLAHRDRRWIRVGLAGIVAGATVLILPKLDLAALAHISILALGAIASALLLAPGFATAPAEEH